MTEPTAVVETDDDAQDAPVEAPDFDVEAALAEVQGESIPAHGLLNAVWTFRSKMQQANDLLAKMGTTKHNFESKLNASDDPKVAEIREAILRHREKIAKLQQMAGQLLGASEEETMGEERRAALKVEKREARKAMYGAANVFKNFADQVPGISEFLPLLERILPEKSETTVASASNGAPTTETGLIREWAKSQGMHVNERGRIPQNIVDRYKAANPPVNVTSNASDNDPDE